MGAHGVARSRPGVRSVAAALLIALASVLLVGALAERGDASRRVAGLSSESRISAHDGAFWLGPQRVVLRGMFSSLANDPSRYGRIASWGMNLVRLRFSWSRLEPRPPLRRNDGTWVHDYNAAYLDLIRQNVTWAAQNHLKVDLVNERCACTYFGYPSWLYQAPFNSHGITYPETPEGALQAQADFWSDPLRQRFADSMLAVIAQSFADDARVAGVEVMNDPQRGNMPDTMTTAQNILDWQLQAARAVRRKDAGRIVEFTTEFGADDWKLMFLDLTGFQALGNVAFSFELSGSPQTQGQWATKWLISGIVSGLESSGIPAIAGKFGDDTTDPAVATYYTETVGALEFFGVSWACQWGPRDGIVKADGTLQPWAWIVIAAAGGITKF